MLTASSPTPGDCAPGADGGPAKLRDARTLARRVCPLRSSDIDLLSERPGSTAAPPVYRACRTRGSPEDGGPARRGGGGTVPALVEVRSVQEAGSGACGPTLRGTVLRREAVGLGE